MTHCTNNLHTRSILKMCWDFSLRPPQCGVILEYLLGVFRAK
jgi:hypothetical protein